MVIFKLATESKNLIKNNFKKSDPHTSICVLPTTPLTFTMLQTIHQRPVKKIEEHNRNTNTAGKYSIKYKNNKGTMKSIFASNSEQHTCMEGVLLNTKSTQYSKIIAIMLKNPNRDQITVNVVKVAFGYHNICHQT